MMRQPMLRNAVRILAASIASALFAGALLTAPALAVDAPDALGPWEVGHRRTFAVPPHLPGGPTVFIELWYPTDVDTGAFTEYFLFNLLFTTLVIDSTVAREDVAVASAGNFPLIVFSHGSGGIPNQSPDLGEALASHGFIVIATDHYNNLFVGGSQPFAVTARQRPKDISWAIDYMLARNADGGDDFFGAIDSSRIGLTGHSFGGFTTYAVASGFTNAFCDETAVDFGEECTTDLDCDCGGACAPGTCDQETVAADARVKVIVPVSPAHGILSDAELESVALPTLCMDGTAEPASTRCTRPFPLTQANAPANCRANVIDAVHTAFAAICPIGTALIQAGICPSLSDPPPCDDPPPTDPAEYTAWIALGAGGLVDPFIETCVDAVIPLADVTRLQSLYTVAFMRRHLNGETDYDPFLTVAYAETEPDIIFLKGALRVPVLSVGGVAALGGLLSGTAAWRLRKRRRRG
jgi:predicted dienelactone hydrolase